MLPLLHNLLSRLVPSPTSPSTDVPLEPHCLATEASALKIRLLKARAAIEALPDIDRLPEQQEQDIRALEARLQLQRDVLTGLGRRVVDGRASADESMNMDD